MAALYISEFANVASFVGTAIGPVMAEPSLADQKVAIGASSAQSAAFSAKTNAVMVAADAVCSIAFGANPAATASNFRLPANGNPVVFAVVPGTKVAVITNT